MVGQEDRNVDGRPKFNQDWGEQKEGKQEKLNKKEKEEVMK